MANNVNQIADPAFEWGVRENQANPGGPWALVSDKFEQSIANADEMMQRLVGTDGNSGYLGELNSIIQGYLVPSVPEIDVTLPNISVTPDTRPSLSLSNLDTDFPEFTTTPPSLQSLPAIDTTDLDPGDLPAEITDTVNFVEQSLSTDVYTDLLAKLVDGLQNGGTGLDATVEAEIWQRALDRQQTENDQFEQTILNQFSARGFPRPTGALNGTLLERAAEVTRNNTALNAEISIEQARLAQNNTQFIITASNQLESVIRSYSDGVNTRKLDYAKAVAAHAVSIYSETLRGYISKAEAKRAWVQAQVENLRGVVEGNKGLVESFKAEAEAYQTIIQAKSSKNEGVIEAFKGEVQGYEAETRAISENQRAELGIAGLEIQKADLELRRILGEINAELQAYTTESSLRERVAEAMANIAMQSVASAYQSVNASAGLSYTGHESQSESYTHTEGRSMSYAKNESLNETHSYEDV